MENSVLITLVINDATIKQYVIDNVGKIYDIVDIKRGTIPKINNNVSIPDDILDLKLLKLSRSLLYDNDFFNFPILKYFSEIFENIFKREILFFIFLLSELSHDNTSVSIDPINVIMIKVIKNPLLRFTKYMYSIVVIVFF
jgi:hypothetical protein